MLARLRTKILRLSAFANAGYDELGREDWWLRWALLVSQTLEGMVREVGCFVFDGLIDPNRFSQKTTIRKIILQIYLEPLLITLKRVLACFRDKYSKSTENFKRPKNHKDSSDLDENRTNSIAATQIFISKSFPRRTASKKTFSKKKLRENFEKKNRKSLYCHTHVVLFWR